VVDPLRHRIVDQFRNIGFLHVSLDLEGYVSGSMNRSLDDAMVLIDRPGDGWAVCKKSMRPIWPVFFAGMGAGSMVRKNSVGIAMWHFYRDLYGVCMTDLLVKLYDLPDPGAHWRPWPKKRFSCAGPWPVSNTWLSDGCKNCLAMDGPPSAALPLPGSRLPAWLPLSAAG
jgi:hypothetical protein